ncbi:MAG: hypothetical protein Q8L14_39135 [Myxococcales bacterium]|nr:hypothetical protein [Myxococcales bacterium]
MKRVLAALAAASWLVACGGGTTTPPPTGPTQYDQTQKPVSPKGSIIVRVVDVGTASPLEGVTVKVPGSDIVGTTNADGIFKFDNMVVNSTYMFIFEKAGYLRARTSTSISGSAGNSPLENSTTTFSIDLYPANGSVSGFVFLPNGNPAPNATVYVDQRNNIGSSAGESIVSATTGMDGSFTLMGLATAPTGVSTRVYARWYDENGDMQADYASTSSFVTLFPGQPGRVFITYSASSIGQQIIASNVFDGQIAAGEDLQFTFALPLFTGTLQGMGATPWTLSQVSNGNSVPVEGTFMSATELRVKPALNSLREGERYTLTLALRNASTNQGTNSQFNATISFQVRPAMVMPFTAQVSGLTVTNSNPIAGPFGPTAFDFSSNTFTIAFSPAAGAVRYELYARDTRNNPNYVLVQPIAATGAPRIETTFVSLPGTFNAPFSQPLAGGNRVNFAVVGIDAYGTRAPLMAATPVEVRDTVPPTAGGVVYANATPSNPTVDAINDTSAPATIRLRITYSEPMDPASMVTYTTTASPAPMSAWNWESSTAGILTLTIGANNDASGSFAIRGGRDAAGNDIVRAGDLVGSLTGRRELLANGDFQMGATCGLGSWTPSTLNSGPAPAAVNNNGAIAGSTSPCAAVLGSIPGGAPGVGRSRIVQDVTLASLMGTGHRYEFTGRHRTVNVVNNAAPGASYSFGCRVTTPADVLVQPLFNGNPNAGYLTSGPIDLSAQAGNSIRIQCETDNVNMMAPGFGAMYLDELSVALVKPGTL